MAKQNFEVLSRIWAHANIKLHRKLDILDSCVVSKLLYGLHTACLSKTELRRVDGFYARCLRRVLRVPPAYISRVSNDTVLRRARRTSLSTRLRQQQLILLGKVARRADEDPVRRCVFEPGGLVQRPMGQRKRGRPRRSWNDVVCKAAAEISGTQEKLCEYMAPAAQAERAWRTTVRRYRNNL